MDWLADTPESEAFNRKAAEAREARAKAQPRKVEFLDICVCGHTVSRHELVGTEYARCLSRSYKSLRCQCNERSRVAVQVEKGGGQVFRRKARGSERPHVLDTTIELYKTAHVNKQVVWVIAACERCGVAEGVETWAMESDGMHVQAAGSLEDTGRHARLCGTCAAALSV